jgi:hypothetical protein
MSRMRRQKRVLAETDETLTMPGAPYTACVLSEGGHAKVLGRIVRSLMHRCPRLPEHRRPSEPRDSKRSPGSLRAAPPWLWCPAGVRSGSSRPLRPAPGRLSRAAHRSAARHLSSGAWIPCPSAAWLSACPSARLSAGFTRPCTRRSPRHSCARIGRGHDGRPRTGRLPLRQRLGVRSSALQHAVRQVRIPVRRRERRLHSRGRVPRRLLRPEAPWKLRAC